jgi:orotate phosphoribosyltransferase
MLKNNLVEAFYATHAYKWDPNKGFRLASGLTSPYYVDCRALMAQPSARALVAGLAWQRLNHLPIDCIGGLEIGAISIATTISDYAYTATPGQEWRTFVVRKQPKDHGLGKLIEGVVKSGDRALIVDREEQDARHKVEAEGLSLLSLLTIDDLTGAQPTRP